MFLTYIVMGDVEVKALHQNCPSRTEEMQSELYRQASLSINCAARPSFKTASKDFYHLSEFKVGCGTHTLIWIFIANYLTQIV